MKLAAALAKLLPHDFPPTPPTQSHQSPHLKSVYNDEPSLQFLESRLPANTELLNAGKELLEAERSHASDEQVLHALQKWICLALHLLEKDGNYSQEQFRKDVEELKDQLPAAVAEKYKDLLNLSDALNPKAVALFIAHFAPNSCKDHVDKKEYSSKHCRTDRMNVCLRMTELWAKSLHKEAGGEWSEKASKLVNERFIIVDAKILVTDDTDDHKNEFKQFCDKNDISMAQMNLIGLILVGFIVKHHELGDSDQPLFIIVPSAAAHEDLFSRHGYYQTISTLFFGYIPHFQNWATKTIANLLLYPPEKLKEYSARLLCLYGAIANDIDDPSIFSVPTKSEIAERYAKIVDMSDEEIKELQQNLLAVRKKAGAKAGAMASEAAELVHIWMSEGLSPHACFEMVESQLSEKHANLIRPMLRQIACTKVGNGEDVNIADAVLAWEGRLTRLNITITAMRKQLDEMSEDRRDFATHVYKCLRCGENMPVVRFNQNQLSRCNNPCCVGQKYLPTAPDGSNEWWKYVGSLDTDGLDEHLRMKKMKILGKIDELTAASLGDAAPTQPPLTTQPVATNQKRKVTDHTEKPSKKAKTSSEPAATAPCSSVVSLPKRRRKPCSHEGCKNQAQKGGLCQTHGGGRRLQKAWDTELDFLANYLSAKENESFRSKFFQE